MAEPATSEVLDGETHWRQTARPTLILEADEVEFRRAMAEYKRSSGRQFPTWSEILEILRSLGYEKRIWKPVDPDFDEDPSGLEVGESVQGWFSRVELVSVD